MSRRLARRIARLLASVLPFAGACAGARVSDVTYAAHGGWKAYDARLPSELRLSPEARLQESTWTWQGYRVHLDELGASGAAKGTVVLLHGGGGNGRLLMAYAPMLSAAGWHVVAPDFPGFGLTQPEDGPLASLSGWGSIAAALATARRQATGQPVVLVGMSVGSTVAYDAAARGAPVDGIAITMFGDPADADVRRALAGSWWRAHVLLPLSRWTAFATDGMRWRVRDMAPLTRMTPDSALVRVFRDDPLIGRRRVRGSLLRSMVATPLAVPPESFTRVPVLLLVPDADAWTPAHHSEATFRRLAAPKRMVVLPGAGHFPIEPMALAVLRESLLEFFDTPTGGPTPPPSLPSPRALP